MAGLSTEAQMSIAALSTFPGFRFSPTDEELISFYLKNKLDGLEDSVQLIAEVEIYKYEPWDLPAKSVIQSENEWFFFSPRGRKYPNGTQSRRATELGYWKATGKERNVKSGSNVIGTKRTLVFHLGRAPKGERTEWIMHEYCMKEKSQDSLVVCHIRKNADFRQTDNKNASSSYQDCSQRDEADVQECNNSVSEAGIDQGETAVDNYSKICHSLDSSEMIDSASCSNQRGTTENTLGESSCHQRDLSDDDLFADILKDEIIKLDESNFDNLEEVTESQQHVQLSVSEALPPQGSANRRIRFKQQQKAPILEDKFQSAEVNESGYIVDKVKSLNIESLCRSLMHILSPRSGRRHQGVVVSVILISLALFVFFIMSACNEFLCHGS